MRWVAGHALIEAKYLKLSQAAYLMRPESSKECKC